MDADLSQDTGQVYANFFSIDPNPSPPNVLNGFLPPEPMHLSDPVADALVPGRGGGLGHVNYTIKAKPTVATGTQIHNVALISYDNPPVIATNQLDPHNPVAGTFASKEATVTIDSARPPAACKPCPPPARAASR